MTRLLALFLALILPVAAYAAKPLNHVRHARALLGADTWSRVIQIENVSRDSVYPRTVYALVFEFSGLLWFYTDTNGTQSLSLHQDDLAAEKANFDPLFRAIDPGFVRHKVVTEKEGGAQFDFRHELPNGCFIESLAALRARIDRGVLIKNARLLNFHTQLGGQPKGHTVLLYETPRGMFLYDSVQPGEVREVTRETRDRGISLGGEAMPLAELLNPDFKIVQARWVPTTIPPRANLIATLDIGNLPKSLTDRSPTSRLQ